MLELLEPKTDFQIRGLVAADDLTIVAVERRGDEIVNVDYSADDDRNGSVSQRMAR